MNIGQAVAKRLGDLLREHNKTQYRLAKDMAISHNAMTSIVNAKNKTASLNTIFLICRALDMTIDEFFNDPVFKSDDLDF